MLKKRHDVGEAFVKRQDVFIGWLHEVTFEPVHYCIGHFVCDDVVGKTGKDILTRQILTRVVSVGTEIPN